MAFITTRSKNYDPKNALVSGNNGMDHLRHISAISSNILKKDGLIFLEVGKGQAIEVVEMLGGDFKEIEVLKDFSGIRRFVIGKRNKSFLCLSKGFYESFHLH